MISMTSRIEIVKNENDGRNRNDFRRNKKIKKAVSEAKQGQQASTRRDF
jgi:hypothetical protein